MYLICALQSAVLTATNWLDSAKLPVHLDGANINGTSSFIRFEKPTCTCNSKCVRENEAR